MTFPIGKGYFIWLLYLVAGGDPKRLAQICKDAGLSWVALKVADSAYPFYADEYKKTVDLVPTAVQELHSAGMKVFGWHYFYGYPIGEAAVAVKRLHVKTSSTVLRIYRSPGLMGEILGFMTPNKAYGNVQIDGEWGRLAGVDEQWINLNYTVGIS